MEVCPVCGCPIAPSGGVTLDTPQQVEVTGGRMTKKMKKIALIAGSAFVLILVMILGIGQIQKKKVADEAERVQT